MSLSTNVLTFKSYDSIGSIGWGWHLQLQHFNCWPATDLLRWFQVCCNLCGFSARDTSRCLLRFIPQAQGSGYVGKFSLETGGMAGYDCRKCNLFNHTIVRNTQNIKVIMHESLYITEYLGMNHIWSCSLVSEYPCSNHWKCSWFPSTSLTLNPWSTILKFNRFHRSSNPWCVCLLKDTLLYYRPFWGWFIYCRLAWFWKQIYMYYIVMLNASLRWYSHVLYNWPDLPRWLNASLTKSIKPFTKFR